MLFDQAFVTIRAGGGDPPLIGQGNDYLFPGKIFPGQPLKKGIGVLPPETTIEAEPDFSIPALRPSRILRAAASYIAARSSKKNSSQLISDPELIPGTAIPFNKRNCR